MVSRYLFQLRAGKCGAGCAHGRWKYCPVDRDKARANGCGNMFQIKTTRRTGRFTRTGSQPPVGLCRALRLCLSSERTPYVSQIQASDL